MFFTARLLEQATDEPIAAYKAGRFPRSGLVADLCCGLGGDLLAFGGHGQAIGIDRNTLSAQLAHCNCRAAGLNHVEVAVADVRSIEVSGCRAWHMDPDRRPGGHRTSRLDFSEPGLDAIAKTAGSAARRGDQARPGCARARAVEAGRRAGMDREPARMSSTGRLAWQSGNGRRFAYRHGRECRGERHLADGTG